MGGKELVSQVGFVDFVGEIGGAVYVWSAVGWLYVEVAINCFDVWVIEGIDVYGHSFAVVGNLGCVANKSKVEAG